MTFVYREKLGIKLKYFSAIFPYETKKIEKKNVLFIYLFVQNSWKWFRSMHFYSRYQHQEPKENVPIYLNSQQMKLGSHLSDIPQNCPGKQGITKLL